MLSHSDIKNENVQSSSSLAIERLKQRLDGIIEESDLEANDIVQSDILFAQAKECVTYYVTGYLCKQGKSMPTAPHVWKVHVLNYQQ